MPMLERPSKLTSYRFDQLADQINQRVMPAEADVERYVGLEHLDPDSLRIRRWGDPSEVESTKLRFEPGDIIFGKRRVYQRKVAVADTEGICSAHAMVLRAKPDTVLPEFLPFFMQSDLFMERALSISVGSLSPTINWKALAKEEFLLPPIQEQARLVETLAAHRAAFESLQELEDRLTSVQNAYVEDLLKARFKSASVLKVKQLLTEGPRNGKSPSAAEGEGGFQSVSLSAVSNGQFNPEGCIKFVEIENDDAEPFLVKAGDAFAVRGNGNRNLMGKVGISSKSYDDLIYPDLLIRLRFDETVILKEFAVAQWNHPSVHARLAARAKSSNGIWKVNGQDIRAHSLVVPSMDEQKEIVSALQQYRSNIASVKRRRQQLRDLLKKVHEQAFSGTVV
jgi:restriction endonuclease S subunit